jgi:hypothetical protein
VAQLVVDRRTKSADRRRAVPQPEEAETHLRNIFRKINVASRVELARTVERADEAASATSR